MRHGVSYFSHWWTKYLTRKKQFRNEERKGGRASLSISRTEGYAVLLPHTWHKCNTLGLLILSHPDLLSSKQWSQVAEASVSINHYTSHNTTLCLTPCWRNLRIMLIHLVSPQALLPFCQNALNNRWFWACDSWIRAVSGDVSLPKAHC